MSGKQLYGIWREEVGTSIPLNAGQEATGIRAREVDLGSAYSVLRRKRKNSALQQLAFCISVILHLARKLTQLSLSANLCEKSKEVLHSLGMVLNRRMRCQSTEHIHLQKAIVSESD